MKHSLKSRASLLVHRSPTLFSIAGKYQESARFERRVLRRGDDLVLEGYPRSANTYATQAFRIAQPRPVKIGNHFHSPMQVHLACRFGLPAGVFYRDPMEAALSLVVFYQGKRSPAWALRRYIEFYERTLELDDGWVPIPMKEAIGPPDVWISRINRTFGSSFHVPSSSELRPEAIKAEIEAKRQKRAAARGDEAASLARQTTPSDLKTELKQRAKTLFDAAELDELKAAAISIYDRINERHGRIIAQEALTSPRKP